MPKKLNSNPIVPLVLDYDKYVVESIYTDKKGFKISTNLLEDLIKKSKESNKEPLLILAIKRNDKQIIKVICNIEVS